MMTISTRGRYAARIMVFLARQPEPWKATKNAISAAEDITPNYVEQIMLRLRAADLINSHRGRCGGFSLARPPADITLSDVLHATSGPVTPAPCVTKPCKRGTRCPTRSIWHRAASAAENVFASTTLADLAQG